ncbi:MAG: virion core protein, T7 gp14 family [Armatimonadaceae bacterium]
MCEPVTIMTALAVTSAAAGVVSQVKAAKAQQRAINEQYAEVVQQNNESATSQLNERLREQRREQGRIKVAAGESGLQLSGSIAGLLQDSLMQAGMAEDAINVNRDNANIAAGREAGSMMSRVEQPTVLGAGLQLASAGMQGYSAGVNIQNANASAKATAAA